MSESDDQSQPASQDLVVIGASAGGIEALSILVNTLPPDFPAPIVLAQHLDPNRPSLLSEILERRTSLRVELVQGRSKLKPSSIYVVPSNYHVVIQDGHVEMLLDHQGRPKPSVDRLLSTAAESYGEHLIAVILTGSGSDGASGAVDVKASGGTVIVQNPQTARYPSMPMSLPPTVVDVEADLERIGPLIYDLLTGVEITQPDKSEDMLRRILEHVNRQVNIDFRAYKSSTMLRRIARRMTVTHNPTIRDYAEFLEAHPEEVGELVQALLINVTEFFRDRASFDYLRLEVLPALLVQARARDRVLRIWSAGCASGEEPYSLAMLIAVLLGAELPEWSIKIFATDLDEAAINFARLGMYPENLLKDMPDDYRERFFERVDHTHTYRIAKVLRQMVIFGQQDLSRSAPFPRVDLVLCRNVLIYFTPDLQDYVLNQFAFSLRPSNGYLFLGKAEIIRPTHSYFELVNKQWKIYRCTGKNVPMQGRQPAPNLRARLEGQSALRSTGRAESVLGEHETLATTTDLALLRRVNELLLRFLPTGVVVIDRAYHVLTMNAAARRLLGLRDANSEQDFLHAVRGIPYAEVRSAIDRVFRERNTLSLPEILLDNTLGGNGLYLCLTIVPMQMDANLLDLAAISVTDVTEQIQTRQSLETAQAEQAQLVSELGTANKRLSEINKELLDANEELQVANEEMMLTYEELQATNEEFEATNEELQATNEELETNNEELQATNEELQTTNDELRARSLDLQELATMFQNDRTRFAEMVDLAPFYIMVLRGPDLIVDAFNSGYARLLEGRELRGQPLAEVAHYFWQSNHELVDLAHQVYAENAPRTSQRMLISVTNPQGELIERYFVYMLVPTHDGDTVDGVAIYATDVTEQRTQEVLQERERLRLIFQHAEQMALGLYDVESMELVMATPQYLQILGRAYPGERQSFLGSLWYGSAFIAEGEDALMLWYQARNSLKPVRLPEAHLKLAQDSEETVWNWSLVPIMDPLRPNQIRYMMALAIEITVQVHAREDAERLDHLKDEFLSLASHELRTPLTSLIGNAYIMERLVKEGQSDGQSESSAKLAHYVGSIRKQLERLNVLIEDLIDVSRLQSGKYTLNMERVEMSQVVGQAVEEARLISEPPPIMVDMPADDPLPVWGDRVRLMQVLLNLLQNALTYAADSPQIDVRVRHENDPASNGQTVRIEVQDYGPGIAPEDQSAIFSRFYQASGSKRSSHRGLGLGLFICKELVEQHHGSIAVYSRVGQGSTFVIELPLYNGNG